VVFLLLYYAVKTKQKVCDGRVREGCWYGAIFILLYKLQFNVSSLSIS
jgi:hypothetical protein